MENQKFDEWCILEIMGHQRYAGRVSEQPLGGASFVRIDIPQVDDNPAFTKLFGASSVYAITPVSEEVARSVAATLKNAPISVWDLPEEMKAKLRQPMISAPARVDDEDFDEEEAF